MTALGWLDLNQRREHFTLCYADKELLFVCEEIWLVLPFVILLHSKGYTFNFCALFFRSLHFLVNTWKIQLQRSQDILFIFSIVQYRKISFLVKRRCKELVIV